MRKKTESRKFLSLMDGGRKSPLDNGFGDFESSEISNLLKYNLRNEEILNYTENPTNPIPKEEFLYYFNNFPAFRDQVLLLTDTFRICNSKVVSEFRRVKREKCVLQNSCDNGPSLADLLELMERILGIGEALQAMVKNEEYAEHVVFEYNKFIKRKLLLKEAEASS